MLYLISIPTLKGWLIIEMSDFFSFKLPEDFVEKYKSAESPFGFVDAGGNSLGEITFVRTYSRVKEDGTKEKQIGLIAQEVEEFFPEGVQLNGVSDYKTVRYSEMVGLLINAIKEQQLMIEDLTKRVEGLES